MSSAVRGIALKVLCATMAVLLLSGCATGTPGPTADLAATEAAIRAEVVATVTAQVPAATASPEPVTASPPTVAPSPSAPATLTAASTPEPTATLQPTATESPTGTPTSTSTPEPTATITATSAPTHAPSPSATPTQEPVPSTLTPEPTAATSSEYTVQPGDSLSKIASSLGVSVKELAALNGITDPSRIYVGQVLRVPPKVASSPTAITGGNTRGDLEPTPQSADEAERYATDMLFPVYGITLWIEDISDMFINVLAEDPFEMCLGSASEYDDMTANGTFFFAEVELVNPPPGVEGAHGEFVGEGMAVVRELRAAKTAFCVDGDTDAAIGHFEEVTEHVSALNSLLLEIVEWLETQGA